MKYVILGAGPAGVTAAETLRSIDPTGEILMIGGEPEPPYSRMALPYLIYGKVNEDGTYLRQNPNHYESLRIGYIQGPVKSLDPDAKTVTLENGEAVSYDKLLIATGATPIVPPIDGADLPGVHPCWTLEDSREILKIAEEGAPVVLVGAGFIGSIILEALYLRKCKITVVELESRMVARMMDEIAGGMLGRWCEKKGVRVLTDTKVESLEKASGEHGVQLGVNLSNGEQIPAALVVMAIGVKSSVDFIEGTGMNKDTGIIIDEYMQTSIPDIYAAGDCCEGIDLSTGKHDMLAIQPVAVEHGRIAAMNMAGRKHQHRGSLNMNVLDTMGLISSSFGLWQGADGGETATLVDEENFQYLKLNFDGNKMVGAQCVGLTDHVGMLRGLIQTGFDLGDWKEKLMKEPQRLRQAYLGVAHGSPTYYPPFQPHVNPPKAGVSEGTGH